MKGYPRVIATVFDFEYLVADPEFKARALVDLKAVIDLADDTMERVKSSDTDEAGRMINIVMETVPAPNPSWKRMGFESREAARALYLSNGGA